MVLYKGFSIKFSVSTILKHVWLFFEAPMYFLCRYKTNTFVIFTYLSTCGTVIKCSPGISGLSGSQPGGLSFFVQANILLLGFKE